ncbi:MAG TPA: hypothetical protein PJ982_10440, partial [Lacipirellulaceae bacterium]|nr:hypothetical protein [Lacipirellulaceae bacterium]
MRVFMMGACFAALLGATLATHQAAAQSSGRAIAGGTRILRAAGRTPAALRSGTAHAGRNVVGGTRGVFSPGVVGPTRGAAGYGGQQYARSYRTWSGPAVGGQHYAATTGGGQPYATGYRGIDGPGMGSGAGYGQSGYRIPSDGRVHQLRFDAHGR